jgi:Fur family ferric uptake transcriptional regulator
MTVAHVSAPLHAPTVATAISALRARGMRVSAARRLLLEALYAAARPLSAEELAGEWADLASVYRNLETLEEVGLVRHVHLGHGPGLYAPASPREYAVCDACGAVHSFADGELDGVRAAVRAACGYAVGFGHFPLVGRCPSCDAPEPVA